MFRRKAILIIHGFAGGTYDQEYLANFLELDRGFDVYTFTLPGHNVVDSTVKKRRLDKFFYGAYRYAYKK